MNRGHACDRHFLHISIYFCTYGTILRGKIGKVYSKAYSMSVLQGMGAYIFRFNFILSRDLVMTVNIPVQERNATCWIIAIVGNLTH